MIQTGSQGLLWTASPHQRQYLSCQLFSQAPTKRPPFLQTRFALFLCCLCIFFSIHIPGVTGTYLEYFYSVQECKLEKTFGVASDNVVFVLDNGAFNISALVSTLEAGLMSVLGEFSSLAGDVVGSPALSATLAAVNAASTLLG